MTVITEAAQVTPEWLTAVLRREGVLASGAVRSVDTVALPHLTLRYSDASPRETPARLFLKRRAVRNILGGVGKPEVDLYRRLRSHAEHLPMLLRCYDAEYDAIGQISHVLLQDFASTHAVTSALVPAPAIRERIVDCTARFHAYWWEHPDLEDFAAIDPNLELDCADAAAYGTYVASYRDAFGYFADFMGERLSPDDRSCFATLLAALPALWDRYLAARFGMRQNVTLVQGDGHWGQFACPHDPEHGRTYLFDLECIHVGLPAADLAYRIALDWTPEQRQLLEQGVLERYSERLRAAGVGGYTPAICWQDYRLAVVFLLLYPLKRFTARYPDRADHALTARKLPGWWAGVYARTLSNYRDLRCEELLS